MGLLKTAHTTTTYNIHKGGNNEHPLLLQTDCTKGNKPIQCGECVNITAAEKTLICNQTEPIFNLLDI